MYDGAKNKRPQHQITALKECFKQRAGGGAAAPSVNGRMSRRSAFHRPPRALFTSVLRVLRIIHSAIAPGAYRGDTRQGTVFQGRFTATLSPPATASLSLHHGTGGDDRRPGCADTTAI